MSRRYDRRQVVTALASRVLSQIATDPQFILGNYVKPKPRFIPRKVWAWLVHIVIKFPERYKR